VPRADLQQVAVGHLLDHLHVVIDVDAMLSRSQSGERAGLRCGNHPQRSPAHRL
jgi:hypothetical protein